jgi:hypothetical protein
MESRKARRLAPGVAALALGSALAVAAPAAAFAEADVNRQSFTIPFAFQTTNTCNGELIDVSETLHFGTTTVTDSAGQHHVTETTIATGTGEGSEGNQYSLARQSHITQFRTDDFAPFVQTVVHHFRLVGQSGAPSIVLAETITFTINANGDLTASVSNITSECREP